MENMTLADSVFSVQFSRLLHGGGECNCWNVMQVATRQVNNNSASLVNS